MSRRALPPLVLLASFLVGAARAETTVTIVDDMPGAGRLTAPATGQTLYILDDAARSITAIDPFAPGKRWRAIGSADLDAGAAEPVRPTAIACVDSNTLAVACQAGADWSLRVFRLAPPGPDGPPPALLQTLPLGTSTAAATTVDVFVSDTRDWLAVVGLPAPLPPVVRAPIAGARLGGFSDRLCPPAQLPARLVAATCSPFDEWVVFSRRDDPPPGRTSMAFLTNAGRQKLLDLDLRLEGVRDAAYCRGSDTLWVVADGDGTDAAGLWRIDSVLEDARQVARPVAIARLPSPLSVTCLSERAIAVSGGGTDRRVLLVNPTHAPRSP